MTITFYYLLIAYLLLIARIQAGHIQSWDISTAYNYDGFPQQFTLIFNLESGLGPDDYILIKWPYSIGLANNVYASVYEYESSVLIGKQKVPAHANSAPPLYYFTPGSQLLKNVWYRLLLYVSVNSVQATLPSKPVQMRTVSSTEPGQIIYDMNLAFGHVFLAPSISTKSLNIDLSLDQQEFNMRSPGAIYNAFIDITPSQDSPPGGAFFHIMIDQGSHIDGSTDSSDFQFLGSCYSSENSCSSAIAQTTTKTLQSKACKSIAVVESLCTINSDLKSIVFDHSQGYKALETFRVHVQIKNPVYISTRDIKIYATSKLDGRTLENGLKLNTFSVTSINVLAGQKKFLWGLDENEPVAEIPFKLFKQQLTGGNNRKLGPINSIYIGFFVQSIVPVGTEFVVYVDIQATGVLEGSILTNLPSSQKGKDVLCTYSPDPASNAPLQKKIRCKGVGAFTSATIEYFIAAKIYYDSSAADPTNYGAVTIRSVVPTVQGSVGLFNSLGGSSISLFANTEYLDLNGWHDPAQFGLGTTQIVSAVDDGTLSATPNAINSFLLGNDASVGIFPDLTTNDQQLLFFIKADVSKTCGDDTVGIGSCDPTNMEDKYQKMNIMFNSQVIKFVADSETLGIDMAAYDSVTSKWLVDPFPCYSTQRCTWYNRTQVQANTMMYVQNAVKSRPYGVVQFECGVKSNVGNNVSNCSHFQGKGSVDGNSGVVAMRHVYFKESFRSQIYPDDNLMDFVISFSVAQGFSDGTISTFQTVTASLINAYTLDNTRLSNIKVSYINFYGHASKSNSGVRVPLLLRIGGSVLATEHSGADRIQIFFDDSMDSSQFYTDNNDETNTLSVGCSSGWCKYYAASGVLSSKHTWQNSKRIEIGGLPNIESEFNILIPIQNTPGQYPTSIVIAFTVGSLTSQGVSGRQKVLKVYRIFGPVIKGQSYNALGTVNGLAANTDATLAADFNTDWKQTVSDHFNYQVDSSQIKPGGGQDMLVKSGQSTLTFTAGDDRYGAGLTITSFFYNVFQSCTGKFVNVPSSNPKCTRFSYNYNDATAGAAYRNGQKIYTLFCPIDTLFDVSSSYADVLVQSPKFPSTFVTGFPLAPVFALSFSTSSGQLIAFKQQRSSLPLTAGSNQCQTDQTVAAVHPSSVGKQRMQFPIKINQDISFDSDLVKGYQQIKITVKFSSSVSGLTFLVAQQCLLSSPDNLQLQCTYIQSNPDLLTFLLSVVGSPVSFVVPQQTTMILSVFCTATGVLSPDVDVTYNVKIILPNVLASSGGTVQRIFGDAYDAVQPALLAECNNGVFQISQQQLENKMFIGSLTLAMNNENARGGVKFSFSSVSQRDEFYSTSRYMLNFGFLRDPNEQLVIDNAFRCVVYESETQVSWKWKSMIFSDLTAVQLAPKTAFSSPDQFLFIVKCFGGATPKDGPSKLSPVNIKWMDYEDPALLLNGQEIQAAVTPISFPTGSIITVSANFIAAQPMIQSKKFVGQGLEAFYTFKITTDQNLDYQGRIYLEFSWGIAPALNREGYIECYIHITNDNASDDASVNMAFCELADERRIKIRVNQPLQANNAFYVDVLHVAQPTNGDMSSTACKIWIGLDNDQEVRNGLLAQGTIVDTPPSAAPALLTSLKISSVTASNYIIRRVHSLFIKITLPSSTVVVDGALYVDLTSQYAEQIDRYFQPSCYVYNSNTVELATAAEEEGKSIDPSLLVQFAKNCTFLSKRRLQIMFGSVDATNAGLSQTYEIEIQNLPTPARLPDDSIKNKIKVACFLASNDQSTITHLGEDYRTTTISYSKDTSKIDLNWNFYELAVASDQDQSDETISGSNNGEILLSSGWGEVYVGYYKNVGELAPEQSISSTGTVSQTNFKTDFEFGFSNAIEKFVFFPARFQAKTGTNSVRFKMAANQTTPAGVYLLKVEKISGDLIGEYEQIPPLQIQVKGDTCQINPEDQVYYIPLGGASLPIVLDFAQCFPIFDITVNATLDDARLYQLLSFDWNLTNGKINASSLVNSDSSSSSSDNTLNSQTSSQKTTANTKIMFVINLNSTTGTSSGSNGGQPIQINPGDQATVSFTVNGTNAKSYVNPNPVTLFFTDPDSSTYKIQPIGKSLQGVGLINIDKNIVNMDLQCDQPSIMLWAYGIMPALSALKFSDIYNVLTVTGEGNSSNASIGNKGLKAYYKNPVLGKTWMVYGSEIQTSSVPLKKSLSGLRAGSNYQIKYFCKNQLGLISDATEGYWTMPSNGAYLLKMTLYFNNLLTYYQDNDLTCALARQFQIPMERIYTEIGTTCGKSSSVLITSSNGNSSVNEAYQTFYKYNSDNIYGYMFYIMPDYVALQDTTNMYIREMISSKSFNTTLLAKTAEPATFPQMLELETEDATTTKTPTFSVSSTSIEFELFTVTAQLTNTKGFLVVGLKYGAVAVGPTATSKPTAQMIKNGVLFPSSATGNASSSGVALMNVKMRFTAVNVDQVFIFNKLSSDTIYTLYLTATNDDPSDQAQESEVYIYQFVTKSINILVNIHEQRLLLFLPLLSFLLLIVLF